MRKYIYIILLMSLFSCVEEVEPAWVDSGNSFKDGYLTLSFGHQNYDGITINTRSTVSTEVEAAIINLYAIIFDEDGNKAYSVYYDYNTRKDDITLLEVAKTDVWWVQNVDPGDDGSGGNTTGVLKIKAPNLSANGNSRATGTIYLLGNIDPAVVNLSIEQLNKIENKTELENLVLSFNQESTSRTGNLLMVGSSNITVEANNAISAPTNPIQLVRVDAKIEVNVSINPGAKTYYREDGTTTTAGASDVYRTQTIASFTPTSWRVMNLPKTSYLINKGSNAENGYFDSSEHLFESKVTKNYTDNGVGKSYIQHGFSFYMLENHQESVSAVQSYNDRDLRNKNSDGEYLTKEDGNIWKYAPKSATYIVMAGDVSMEVQDRSDKPQTLNAHVIYYIHLGDFTESKWGNFDISRNHHYIYNVKVSGVSSIEVEVILDNDGNAWSPSNERQSGAVGEVYVAQE